MISVITAETTETIQNETESVISDMWTITESPVQAEGAPADTADDDSDGSGYPVSVRSAGVPPQHQ